MKTKIIWMLAVCLISAGCEKEPPRELNEEEPPVEEKTSAAAPLEVRVVSEEESAQEAEDYLSWVKLHYEAKKDAWIARGDLEEETSPRKAAAAALDLEKIEARIELIAERKRDAYEALVGGPFEDVRREGPDWSEILHDYDSALDRTFADLKAKIEEDSEEFNGEWKKVLDEMMRLLDLDLNGVAKEFGK